MFLRPTPISLATQILVAMDRMRGTGLIEIRGLIFMVPCIKI